MGWDGMKRMNEYSMFIKPWGFLDGSVVKNLPANTRDARDTGLIPGLRRSPGGGNAIHCTILSWRIPWTEEPGGL